MKMEFAVRSLAFIASTGTGEPTGNITTSVKYPNSTQPTIRPTSFPLGTAITTYTPPQSTLANQTVTAFNSSLSSSRRVATPDLNNATECLLQQWAESQRRRSWQAAQYTTFIGNITSTFPVTASVPLHQLGNISYTRLCDGLPRFTDASDATKVMVKPETPILTTKVYQALHIKRTAWDDEPFGKLPSCTSISRTEECTDAWNLLASSLSSTKAAWSSTNVLTISVAPTPTAITINGVATPLTAEPNQLPALPIHGNLYTADPDNTWGITDAYKLDGKTSIRPGQQVTLTWDYYAWNFLDRTIQHHPNCDAPKDSIDQSACSKTAPCTIAADSVDVFIVPPPSTSRDLCQNTSPGFNRYKQSIYSRPHQSAVINGTTFWMDKAYVRYNAISAYRTCEDNYGSETTAQVGGKYTSTLIEVESSDLSTVCGWQRKPFTLPLRVQPPVPINFDDFNGPVPESAYQCIKECWALNGCSSIVQSLFQPNLAVPPQVRGLDKEWEGCVPFFQGTHDPPIALEPVDFVVTVTEPGTGPGASPTVGGSPSAGLPVSTGRPDSNPSGSVEPSKSFGPPGPSETSGEGDQRPPTDTGVKPQPFTRSFATIFPFPGLKVPVPSPTSSFHVDNLITVVGNRPVVVDPSRPGAVVVGTPDTPSATTLKAGDPPLVISGTTLSISPAGTALTVSGPKALYPIATVDGQPVYIDPAVPGKVIVGDISNPAAQKMYEINADGAIVVSGSIPFISPLPSAATPNNPTATQLATMNISGLQITQLPNGSIVILKDGTLHTLQPGAPEISIGGHTISLSPTGELIVDGKPYKFEAPTVSQTVVTLSNGFKVTKPASRKLTAVTSDPKRVLKISSSRSAGDAKGPSSIKGQKKKGGASSRRSDVRIVVWLVIGVVVVIFNGI